MASRPLPAAEFDQNLAARAGSNLRMDPVLPITHTCLLQARQPARPNLPNTLQRRAGRSLSTSRAPSAKRGLRLATAVDSNVFPSLAFALVITTTEKQTSVRSRRSPRPIRNDVAAAPSFQRFRPEMYKELRGSDDGEPQTTQRHHVIVNSVGFRNSRNVRLQTTAREPAPSPRKRADLQSKPVT